MGEIIGITLLCIFGATAVAFPLFVITQSIINLVRASDGRGTIVLKALLVLGLWLVLSLIFVMLPMMYVFEPGRGVDAATADRRMTMLVLALTLIYVAVGLVLGYWVRLQPGWKTLKKTQSEA